ncbi:MAG: UPF0262 family protein [Alphaproteobacteria bacterium]|nr:UPF0262 family protein [Alphaproteobacteria bacterium]
MSTIKAITLDEKIICTIPEVQNEKRQALHDIIAKNHFMPDNDIFGDGPYDLHLSIVNDRDLAFTLNDPDSQEKLGTIILRLSAFRKIVRDYFQIAESHFGAVKARSIANIETIDMARRAIHNEGAEILQQALQSKNVATDTDTSRLLFTLICVLHFRQERRS